MSIHLHRGDLPAGLTWGTAVAVDTETMGLHPGRDRLCLVQLSAGDGVTHLVQIAPGQTEAPLLKALLTDPNVLKLFHFARFDLGILKHALDTNVAPVMGAEDFSFMLEERPGAFIFVGNGDGAGLHHPAYDFNDEVIPIGTSYWVKLVETALAG